MSTVDIHILHTNDVHSELVTFARMVVPLRRIRNELKAKEQCVLTFDIGDHVDISDPLSYATAGRANVAMLTAAGYDGFVFGNNETLTLPPATWNALLEEADMPLLCSNLTDSLSGRNLREGILLPVNGITLGIFGVTVRYPRLHDCIGAHLTDPMEEAMKRASDLRNRGADIVILLSHLGLREDQEMATNGFPIDVIIGGHTHHFLDGGIKCGDTWICQAGKHALAFGHTVLTVVKSDKPRLQVVTSQLHFTERSGVLDEAVCSAAGSFADSATAYLAELVADLPYPLEHALLGESALVNLLCDQLRIETKTELAICIGGVVGGCFRSGELLIRDLLANCPTPMRAVHCKLTGRQVRALIAGSLGVEWAARVGFGFGFRGHFVGQLHVSGATVEVGCSTEDDGREVRSLVGLEIDGQPLVDTTVYEVALCEFLALSSYFSSLGEIAYDYYPELLRNVLGRALGRQAQAANPPANRYTYIQGDE